MVIQIQDEVLHGLKLTEPQALLNLAVGLFTERRGISLHYDVTDLQADLRTLAALRDE